jgi:hypothetical protein
MSKSVIAKAIRDGSFGQNYLAGERTYINLWVGDALARCQNSPYSQVYEIDRVYRVFGGLTTE